MFTYLTFEQKFLLSWSNIMNMSPHFLVINSILWKLISIGKALLCRCADSKLGYILNVDTFDTTSTIVDMFYLNVIYVIYVLLKCYLCDIHVPVFKWPKDILLFYMLRWAAQGFIPSIYHCGLSPNKSEEGNKHKIVVCKGKQASKLKKITDNI